MGPCVDVGPWLELGRGGICGEGEGVSPPPGVGGPFGCVSVRVCDGEDVGDRLSCFGCGCCMAPRPPPSRQLPTSAIHHFHNKQRIKV